MRTRALRVLACGAMLVAMIMSTSVGSHAAPNVTINFEVLSATTLDMTGCPASARTFGPMIPGPPVAATDACTIAFGSSNDSSMLKLYQQDSSGDAMFARPDGTPNAGFGTDGKVAIDFPEGAANAKWGTMLTDGSYLAVGNVNNAGDEHVALARIQSDGTPDTSFGDAGTGRKIHNFFPGTSEVAWDGVVDPDGKITMVGNVSWPDMRVNNAIIMRFDASGQPDLSFNGTGIRELDAFGYDTFTSIVRLPTGSYMAAGCKCNGTDGGDPLLARVLADGTLDTSFGTGGSLVPTTWGTHVIIEDALLLPSGKLLVSGTRDTGSGKRGFVARINQQGALDTTYGTGGIVEVPTMAAANGLTLADPSGAAWLAGRSGPVFDAMLARITAGGAIDTTWAGTGVVTVDIGNGGNDSVYGVVGSSDRSAYVAGDAGGDMHVLAIRDSSTTPLDPAFSADGKALADFGGGYDFATELFWGRSGAVMAVGSANPGPNADFGFFSLQSGGSIADYDGTTAKFISADTQSAFGACLEARSGAGATEGWTLDANGQCTTTDTDPWFGIARTSSDTTSKVLGTPNVGVVDASASIRFGIKVGSGVTPGAYAAPLTFEVIAPNGCSGPC